MVELATRAALGEKLTDLGLKSGLVEPKPYVALKAPSISFCKNARCRYFSLGLK